MEALRPTESIKIELQGNVDITQIQKLLIKTHLKMDKSHEYNFKFIPLPKCQIPDEIRMHLLASKTQHAIDKVEGFMHHVH